MTCCSHPSSALEKTICVNRPMLIKDGAKGPVFWLESGVFSVIAAESERAAPLPA